jgi:hypothetical protein
VAVTGGEHTVDLVYRPPGLRSGLMLSALSLAAVVALAAIGGRRGPRMESPAEARAQEV